jgi:phytanoyl-CoA hydroxylase
MDVKYDHLKYDYDRDGFVVVKNFLSEDEFHKLLNELDRYVREVVPTLPDSAAFFHDKNLPQTLKQLQHMGRDEFFENYRQHPRWTSLAQTLVGEPVEAQEPEWFNKPPGVGHRTPPHQDNFYFCLRPPNVVTLWLALDDVDEENGCLRYTAGSHHQGIRPHKPTSILGFSQGIADYAADDEEREKAVCLAAGDLVAHHGEVIHRADPNGSTKRQRRAFAMVFRGTSCRRDEAAYRRYEQALRSQHTTMGLKD